MKAQAQKYQSGVYKSKTFRFSVRVGLDINYRFIAQRKRISVETCENCGRTIGKLETPRIWDEHVVCAACHDILAKSAEKSGYTPVSQRESRPAGLPSKTGYIPAAERKGQVAGSQKLFVGETRFFADGVRVTTERIYGKDGKWFPVKHVTAVFPSNGFIWKIVDVYDLVEEYRRYKFSSSALRPPIHRRHPRHKWLRYDSPGVRQLVYLVVGSATLGRDSNIYCQPQLTTNRTTPRRFCRLRFWRFSCLPPSGPTKRLELFLSGHCLGVANLFRLTAATFSQSRASRRQQSFL